LKKRIVNIIGTILILAALVFIVNRFISLGVDFSLFTAPKTLALVAGLSVAQLALLLLFAYAWRLILGYFVRSSIDAHKTIAIYFKSNIAKYLPGNVGQYVGRQIFGCSLGMTQAQLALSSIFEIGFSVLGAMIVAIAFGGGKIIEVYRTLQPGDNYTLIVVIAVCAMLAAAILLMIFRKHRIIAAIFELFKKKNFWLRSAEILSLYIAQFLAFGAALVLLVQLNAQISAADAPIILAASAIAWIIGFVTPGVPGGIGVRESMLLLMLPMYPQNVILSAAIIQRVVTILGDVLAWAAGAVFFSRRG